jgi:hypothetical protein
MQNIENQSADSNTIAADVGEHEAAAPAPGIVKSDQQQSVEPYEPKYTAVQIKQDCPELLLDLGKQITAHLDKARHYHDKAEQHVTAANQLLAQAHEVCDDGGFAAFQEKFNLGRSRCYELKAIAGGKKSIEDIRASTRKSVARHRANKALSVTVTDSTLRDSPDTGCVIGTTGNTNEADRVVTDATVNPAVSTTEEKSQVEPGVPGPSAKPALSVKAWRAAPEIVKVEITQSEDIAVILGRMSETQKEKLFDRLIALQIEQAKPLASKSIDEMLKSISGTFWHMAGQPDPQKIAEAMTIINAKLAKRQLSRTPRWLRGPPRSLRSIVNPEEVSIYRRMRKSIIQELRPKTSVEWILVNEFVNEHFSAMRYGTWQAAVMQFSVGEGLRRAVKNRLRSGNKGSEADLDGRAQEK